MKLAFDSAPDGIRPGQARGRHAPRAVQDRAPHRRGWHGGDLRGEPHPPRAQALRGEAAPPVIASNQDVFLRFRREAEIASELGHADIVEVHDFATSRPTASRTWSWSSSTARISARSAAGATSVPQGDPDRRQVASALDAAHAARSCTATSSRRTSSCAAARRRRRREGPRLRHVQGPRLGVGGDPGARAHGDAVLHVPRAGRRHGAEIDQRTDIFALGAIIWEMLTGRMAFESPTHRRDVQGRCTPIRRPCTRSRAACPRSCRRSSSARWPKRKEDRYDSVLDFARDLTAAAEGVPPSILPPPRRRVSIPETIPRRAPWG